MIITETHKKLRYRRGTARRAMPVKILLATAELYEKMAFEKAAVGQWPWRTLKVNGIAAIWWANQRCSRAAGQMTSQ